MASICVFCGSNLGTDPALAAIAAALGQTIAAAGHDVVYGGGRVGLMGVVADAALGAGGSVVGIIPDSIAEREVAHTGLTQLVITDSMHTRKQAMCDRSDGVVTLPGGYGTLDEVMEILTWNQIGTIAKPVAFLDVTIGGRSYYDKLFEFFDQAVASGLVKPEHRAMARRVTTVHDAIAVATGPPAANVGKWTDPSVR